MPCLSALILSKLIGTFRVDGSTSLCFGLALQKAVGYIVDRAEFGCEKTFLAIRILLFLHKCSVVSFHLCNGLLELLTEAFDLVILNSDVSWLHAGVN